MKKLKQEKGITLIALIITIIVLVILAAIVLVMVIGENGVISKAQTAKNEYNKSTDDEIEKLEQLYSKLLLADNEGTSLENVDMTTLKALIRQEGNPTGTIIAFYGETAPSGYLSCDGSSKNSADYPELAAFLGASGSTFNLPDLRGEFLRGLKVGENTGAHTDEGLPNIEGTFSTMANGGIRSNINIDSTTGAFYRITRTGWKDGYTDGNNNNATGYAGFEARRSNPIYGNSEHVTPTNTSVLYCIKY